MLSLLRYKQFFDCLDAAALVVDAGGLIADWNSAAEQLFGYNREQIIGQPLALLKHGQNPPRLAELLSSDELAEASWAGNLTLSHRHGEQRVCQATLVPLFADNGERVATVAVLRNMGDDSGLQQRLARTTQELAAVREERDLLLRGAAQQRLTAIGEMASGISHSLINMLGPSVLLSDLLLGGAGQSEHSRELIEAIRTGTMNAVDLVKRLGSLSPRRSQDEPLRPVDLYALIKKMPALTGDKWKPEAGQAGRNISLELQLESVPLIDGNAAELQQCLIDLIDNAADAMTHGGVIALRLQNRPDSILVTVQDSGRGMTELELQRCFEPFFTTKAGGVGLGLSICAGVAEHHGGGMTLGSAPGEGTSVAIEIPVNSVVDVETPVRELAETPSAYRILYIDDEPIACKSMSLLLETLGHETDLAATGCAGIEQFKQRHYDLVISDYSMPGLSGREVVSAIKAINPGARVVLTTGWSSAHIASAAEDAAQEDGILEKPVTVEKLQQMLATVMGSGGVHQPC